MNRRNNSARKALAVDQPVLSDFHPLNLPNYHRKKYTLEGLPGNIQSPPSGISWSGHCSGLHFLPSFYTHLGLTSCPRGSGISSRVNGFQEGDPQAGFSHWPVQCLFQGIV